MKNLILSTIFILCAYISNAQFINMNKRMIIEMENIVAMGETKSNDYMDSEFQAMDKRFYFNDGVCYQYIIYFKNQKMFDTFKKIISEKSNKVPKTNNYYDSGIFIKIDSNKIVYSKKLN